MRNLLILTILVCSTSALGRCACSCLNNNGQKFTARSNASSGCNQACLDTLSRPGGCVGSYTGNFGIMGGVWEIITSEDVASQCDRFCCFSGTVTLDDLEIAQGLWAYQGIVSGGNGRQDCFGMTPLNWAFGNEFPFQRVKNDKFSFWYIHYNETTGRGTISKMDLTGEVVQQMRCISGPCLQNANLYTGGGGGLPTSASTKNVVSYTLYFLFALFITSKL